MPVNTAALKTFAPAMRRQLLEAVGRKLDLLLHSQTPDTLSTYARQIAELREQETENREQLLERVAYTWFNRLCALRYLDARGWHPFGCKVLMPAGEHETQPEVLKLMRAGSLPTELKAHTNEVRLHGLLDGQIPPAIAGADPQGEVYRELVLASCRSYHQLLPELFEGLDDSSELLLPDDLLSEGSIAGGFRSQIRDEDCEDVEVIGWLYQFYISEKKSAVIGKVVDTADIPAATQLFTPSWLVKYLVHNTLGHQWLLSNPRSTVSSILEFLVQDEQSDDQRQAIGKGLAKYLDDPRELTVIDPACGSGHMLIEAYNILKHIYLEQGHQAREIPKLILENNIHGADIDPRATQLTSFALFMKAREDDRRAFEKQISLNIVTLESSKLLDLDLIANTGASSNNEMVSASIKQLKEVFLEADCIGSLARVPSALTPELDKVLDWCQQSETAGIKSYSTTLLKSLCLQAKILGSKYHCVITNPPYLSKKAMTPGLQEYLKDNYPGGSKDAFAAFAIRALEMTNCVHHGVGIVTPNSWMYLVSFEDLRFHILRNAFIESLVELETNAFEPAMVTVCAFTLSKSDKVCKSGRYIRLANFKGAKNQAPRTIEAIKDHSCGWYYEVNQDEFTAIPGAPIAYHLPKSLRESFSSAPNLSKFADLKQGLATTDNSKFLRLWHEVSIRKVGLEIASGEEARATGKRWFPYNKGGEYRKWYGNIYHVVNWQSDGAEIKNSIISKYPYLNGNPGFVAKNTQYYFKEGATWSALSSSKISLRLNGVGFVFDTKGQTLFSGSEEMLMMCASLLNSVVAELCMEAIAPTLDFNAGTVSKVPLIKPKDEELCSRITLLTKEARRIARHDWDSLERSWNFRGHPFVVLKETPHRTLADAFINYEKAAKRATDQLRLIEKDLNEIWINSYNLSGSLSSEVPEKQVTLLSNPAYRYDLEPDQLVSRFRRDVLSEYLSYAVGVLMGRYSLDQPGLILADSLDSQPAHLAAYEEKIGKPLSEVQFKPDADAIIPFLDGEWFEDDIVARTREFLEVTFPESTVTENLRFIEESLGKDIRKYFCSEFYKDHLQTYKKRPIYWMVQSPKKGFACLIYLHRYTKDTLNQVLNNYFRPYLQKLEARLAQLGLDQLNDDLPTRERTAARKEAEKITKVLKECQAWEQDALLPLAQQRIELDLDNGVKVNYLKLQDVLAPIPGLAAKED